MNITNSNKTNCSYFMVSVYLEDVKDNVYRLMSETQEINGDGDGDWDSNRKVDLKKVYNVYKTLVNEYKDGNHYFKGKKVKRIYLEELNVGYGDYSCDLIEPIKNVIEVYEKDKTNCNIDEGTSFIIEDFINGSCVADSVSILKVLNVDAMTEEIRYKIGEGLEYSNYINPNIKLNYLKKITNILNNEEEPEIDDNIEFSDYNEVLDFDLDESGKSYIVIGCEPDVLAVEIPAKYNGLPVKSLDDSGFGAFADHKSLRKIILPNTIKSIPESTFLRCKNLKEIVIPDSVKKIGEYAFANCTSLEKVVFSKNLTSIDEKAFLSCENLKEVILPDGMKSIGFEAFGKCTKLENVYLPDSIKKIDGYCFENCISLESVVLPSSIKNIFGQTFSDCTALKNVTIPEGVTTIYAMVFYNCINLESITIPKSVKSIYESFNGCKKLKTINLSSKLKKHEKKLKCKAKLVFFEE